MSLLVVAQALQGFALQLLRKVVLLHSDNHADVAPIGLRESTGPKV